MELQDVQLLHETKPLLMREFSESYNLVISSLCDEVLGQILVDEMRSCIFNQNLETRLLVPLVLVQ